MSETQTQSAILDYLRMSSYLCFRVNNIPVSYIDKHGERAFRSMGKFAMKGVPDIITIATGRKIAPRGTFIGIEVKSPKGKPSEAQIAFKRACEATGGVYVLARDLQDVIDAGL